MCVCICFAPVSRPTWHTLFVMNVTHRIIVQCLCDPNLHACLLPQSLLSVENDYETEKTSSRVECVFKVRVEQTPNDHHPPVPIFFLSCRNARRRTMRRIEKGCLMTTVCAHVCLPTYSRVFFFFFSSSHLVTVSRTHSPMSQSTRSRKLKIRHSVLSAEGLFFTSSRRC